MVHQDIAFCHGAISKRHSTKQAVVDTPAPTAGAKQSEPLTGPESGVCDPTVHLALVSSFELLLKPQLPIQSPPGGGGGKYSQILLP